MLHELQKIRFARFRFRLRAQTPLLLPPYKGSTLRGGFGISFKEAVCVVDHGNCDRCLLRMKCAYSYIFETPVPEGSSRLASVAHAPHPFVIEPPLDRRTDYPAGSQLELGLLLVGRAVDYLPYFIFAFEHLGEHRGIGKKSVGRPAEGGGSENGHRACGKFSVEDVAQITATGEATTVYDGKSKSLRANVQPESIASATVEQKPRPTPDACPEPSRRALHPTSQLTIQFLTPTRLVFDASLATIPEFHIFIRNLLRRVSNLTYFHCNAELNLDFRGLVDAAQHIRLTDNHTRWHDWERYSARQDAKLKMGGLVGTAVYDGDLQPFAPLLAIGEVLHVGAATGMGLGRYRVGSAVDERQDVPA
jgi:hypothetical protein